MSQDLYAELRAELGGIKDRQQQQRALRQILHERPELREVFGIEATNRPTHRGKSAGRNRLLTEAGYVGDGSNMRSESRGSCQARAPWMAWNHHHMEPVTMTLTEATRRFPRAYGAPWLFPEVV